MWLFGIGLILICGALVVAQPWAYALDKARTRYARPGSKFIDLDGLSLHVMEEGPRNGHAVFVLPGHWGHFAQWDTWSAALTDKYRVLRVDLPGHGLSSQMPDGNYSMDRYIRVLIEAAEYLGVSRYAVVGTSFSGIVAFRTAARHPDQVVALILANSSGLPRPSDGPQPNMPPPRLVHRLLYKVYRPRSFFSWKLRTLMKSNIRITPDRVDLYTALNNVRGRIGEDIARVKAYTRGDVVADLAQIRAPCLVQGSDASIYLAADDTTRFKTLLVNSKVEVKVYPGAGHLIMEDVGEDLGKDARRFLDQVPGTAWLSDERTGHGVR